jgi:hypothetical protein
MRKKQLAVHFFHSPLINKAFLSAASLASAPVSSAPAMRKAHQHASLSRNFFATHISRPATPLGNMQRRAVEVDKLIIIDY